MTTAILIATLAIAGIGALAALALAIADRYLAVKEDPRIGLITAALPGANCGGCGYAGCDGYARALVSGEAANGACAPGAAEATGAIARILGVAAADTQPRVACVLCAGTRSEAIRVGDYNGLCDCASAAATAGGDKGCRYGCLGYGACAYVCPKQAIHIADGLAHVDKRLCIGCGKCVSACPRQLIRLVPAHARIHVLCNNPQRGPEVKNICGVGCIGCHLCEKHAGGPAAGHFTFEGFLARVNYDNPPEDGTLVAKCPRGCIREDAARQAGH